MRYVVVKVVKGSQCLHTTCGMLLGQWVNINDAYKDARNYNTSYANENCGCKVEVQEEK
jgi:hypothetical protein